VDNAEIDKLFTYLICAKEFGWKPDEVDKLDIVLLKDMLTALSYIKEREKMDLKNG
jgi:hypothetical protein